MIYDFNEIFNIMRFPAGEPHIELKAPWSTNHNSTIVCTKVRNFDDLSMVVLGAAILKRYKGTSNGEHKWLIPYFPFGRMDRRRHGGDGLELKLALKMVEHLDVVTIDPHSDVLGQLPHVTQKDMVTQYTNIGAFDNDPIVVIPDLGAAKKAHEWIGKRNWVQFTKVRDVNTGKLSGFKLIDGWLGEKSFAYMHARNCIIVDDICDGGGTFNGIAEILEMNGARELTLAVTHGLFTAGLKSLSEHFARIYCLSPTIPNTEKVNLRTIPPHKALKESVIV